MKILMNFRHFPVAMGRWFHWAFQELGHKVFTVGSYSNGTIPWGNYYFPEYKFPPDVAIPEGNIELSSVLKKIRFKPDIIFQAGDTTFLTGKSPVPNFILETDPHAVDYTERLRYADHVFCMQKCYMKEGQTWIPYGYDSNIHQYIPNTFYKHDVVFCGLQYEHRVKALNSMTEQGLKVFNALGLIYEQYVETYNQGKIAFNWSSKEDLPARFWEGLAMRRLVLTNRVPDLQDIHLKEDVDYVAFSSIEEAVEKAKYYSGNDEAREKIAKSGYEHVQPNTYQNRCKDILKVIQKYVHT